MTEPTIPRTMSAMQPKPRPRAIFPASHPATKPISSHPQNPCGTAIQILRTWIKVISDIADIRPPGTRLHPIGRAVRSSLSNLHAQHFVEVTLIELRNEPVEKDR